MGRPCAESNPNEHGGFGPNIVSACTSRWGTGISDTYDRGRRVSIREALALVQQEFEIPGW